MDDRPAGEALAGETFHNLLRTLRFLRQHTHQMKRQGIRPRGYAALRFLFESGPATVGQVQAYLYNSPSTTSALLLQGTHDQLLAQQGFYHDLYQSQYQRSIRSMNLPFNGRHNGDY